MCRCNVQRCSACGNHSGLIVKTIPGRCEKPSAFPPELLFTFSPESYSPSPRNAFHVHPGIAFTFPRNPQDIKLGGKAEPSPKGNGQHGTTAGRNGAGSAVDRPPRPFTVEEAYGAREAFLTSASQIVMPVVRIDDRPVGNGAPGSVAVALRAEFHRHAEFS